MRKDTPNEIRIARGSVGRVRSVLEKLRARSIFLVTHTIAYQNSGAEAKLEPFLSTQHVVRFTDFEPNPKLQDAERALELLKTNPCDVVLAVGGGSAIDMAKLVCIFAAQQASPQEIIAGLPHLKPKQLPLIAVPTTAGTGSEATHFAVVYVDDKKYSVAHPSLLPDFAMVDPELTYDLPAELTAVTGLDALCQGIESLWAVQSTEESRSFARKAVRLAWNHLETAVHRPTPQSRLAMCQASHLAGRAINLSKTTAPHAIPYSITSRCGMAHGHAVALTLGPILIYNSQVSSVDIGDARGVAYVRETIKEILDLLGCRTPEEACQKIFHLMESIGCPPRLSTLNRSSAELRQHIAEHVNLERLENNPRMLAKEQVIQVLEFIG